MPRAEAGSAESGIDLDAIGEDPMCEANAALADGDVLYVPEARRSVAVLGAVERPGVYPVDDDPTLLEILAASGGPKQDADLSRVKIYFSMPRSFVDLSLADREPVYLGGCDGESHDRCRLCGGRPELQYLCVCCRACGKARNG